jgi:ATP-binding cassette, subfamily B, bacterial PglK
MSTGPTRPAGRHEGPVRRFPAFGSCFWASPNTGPDRSAVAMIRVLQKAIALLDRRERRQLALLGAITPLAALGEMGAVAAMLPFLSAVVDPSSLGTSPLRALLAAALGPTTPEHLVLYLGAVACLVLLLTNTLIVVSVWLLLRFSWSLHHRLSTTLLRKYLHKPYAYFLSQNSAGLTGNLVLQVAQVTEGFMVPALTAFSRGTAALVLILFLAVTEPVLALAALGLISGIHVLFYFWLARRKLGELGSRRVRINRERVRVVSEAFGGIKDIKLLHAEETFTEAFGSLSRAFSRDQIFALLMATTPRYIVEAVAFGGIVMVTLALASAGGQDRPVVPLLGMFAFAGYRLMPSVQQVFAALMQLRANLPVFDSLCEDLSPARGAGESAAAQARLDAMPPAAQPLERIWPRRTIELRRVTFRYPGAQASAVEGFNLCLKAKATTGIVGPTGSGKTTFVDLLLGLLRPGQGELRIDDVCIDDSNIERWHQSIGYVPQHIFLSDTSILRNVAFGVPEPQIDRARVEEACRSARIHEFIEQQLPLGYDTAVGERGVRLSGGERQRIGIARALYRRPEVLVLDEATSALDGRIEEEVMDEIHHLAGKKTLVMIAHRETTLRDCDVIYRITRGRLELVGSYAALLREKEAIREVAG